MSQENLELVRRGFEAFNRGGRESPASDAMLAPDVVWEVAIGVADFDGVCRGRTSVRRFWRTFMAELGDMRIEVEELVDCEEASSASPALVSRGRHSGAIPAGQRTFPVFTVADGLIVRYQLFARREPALDAAGCRSRRCRRRTLRRSSAGLRR
jgi:ketosteroid isomerase-like protein